MSLVIDLNSDLGESFGTYSIGQDEEVLKYITSANIACGYHAGDHNVMAKTVKIAKHYHVGIGAHPGLPDLLGFGRREIDVTPNDVYHFILYQIGALHAFCVANDVKLQHVKPHGALYNMAVKNVDIAEAVAKAIKDVKLDLILFGLSGSALIKAGEKYGLKTASEVFADRTYQDNGMLTPRTEQNALIHDEEAVLKQVVQMIKHGTVMTTSGREIPIKVDTICVHGDGEKAVTFVQKLRHHFLANGISMKKVGEFL